MSAPAEIDQIAHRIRALVAEILRRPPEEIPLDARLDATHLGIDSLGLIKLSVALEEEFEIVLPDFTSLEEAPLGSVLDLARFVSERLAARAERAAPLAPAAGGGAR
jgi:acyl carrier protein